MLCIWPLAELELLIIDYLSEIIFFLTTFLHERLSLIAIGSNLFVHAHIFYTLTYASIIVALTLYSRFITKRFITAFTKQRDLGTQRYEIKRDDLIFRQR